MAAAMPDSARTQSERPVQQPFTIGAIFSYLALFAAVLGGWRLLPEGSDRVPQPPAAFTVRYRPLPLDPTGFLPLKLAGAWIAEAEEPRFGGISALAVDGDRLLALTDSGAAIRLPRPDGGDRQASLVDLPAGPGPPSFKKNRDSEALAADPAGRGWWVAFENRDQLWLFDSDLRRSLTRLVVPKRGLGRNKGIEAMAAAGKALLLFPEDGRRLLLVHGRRVAPGRWRNRFGSLSEAHRLPSGAVLLVARNLTLSGLENRLLRLQWRDGRLEPQLLAALPLGPFDNVEALAAEPVGTGRTRLWLMTDNDFIRRRRTLLLALDMLHAPSQKDRGAGRPDG